MTDPTQPDQQPESPPEKQPAKPDPKPESKPGPKSGSRKRRRWPWVLIVMVLLLGAGAWAGIYFLPELRDRTPFIAQWLPDTGKSDGTDIGADVHALKDRVASLERRVGSIDRDVGAQRDRIARLGAEDTRLAAGVARVEALIQSLEGEPLPETAGGEPQAESQAQPEAPPATTTDRAAEQLAARLDMMLLRLGQLESAFIPLSEKVARQDDARNDRAALRTQTDTMETRVRDLSDRLDRLETAASADARQALLVLTYSAARRAAEAGRAFEPEYEALRDLARDARRDSLEPALDRLSALATRGAPTAADLQDRLDATVADILEAARLPDDPTWWQRFLARAQGWITLRRTDRLDGDGVDAIVARAEAAMARRDLDSALDALDRLTGPAARAAEAWMRDARARLELDRRMARFEDALRALTMPPPDDVPEEGTN